MDMQNLFDKVNALIGSPSTRFEDGYNEAVGDVLSLLEDVCGGDFHGYMIAPKEPTEATLILMETAYSCPSWMKMGNAYKAMVEATEQPSVGETGEKQ